MHDEDDDAIFDVVVMTLAALFWSLVWAGRRRALVDAETLSGWTGMGPVGFLCHLSLAS